MFQRKDMTALLAEFFGSAVLSMSILAILMFTSFPLYVGFAAAIAMGMMVLVFGPLSGAHINPVTTIGMWSARQIDTFKAGTYVAAQMLGGVAGWKLTEFMLDNDLAGLTVGDFDWRVLLAEALGAFVFTLGVSAAMSKKFDGVQQAVTVGGSLLLGMLVASFAANALLNPAVAVGVQSWGMAYALGPIAGGIVGVNVWTYLFAPYDKKSPVQRVGAAARTVKKSVAKKTTRKKTTKKR